MDDDDTNLGTIKVGVGLGVTNLAILLKCNLMLIKKKLDLG